MRVRDDERGAALIAVVVLGFVMMILVATGLTVATSGMRQAIGVQRSTSALDAAFAGVQDYLARLNLDDTYVKYGNRSSSFSATSPVVDDPSNPAFGYGVSTGNATTDQAQHRTWATVPGSDTAGSQKAYFRYEVDTSKYATTGIVQLRVTGLSGQRTRTLLTSLRVRGFVDYAYFTDYEINDPAISGSPASCTKYKWQGRASTCNQYQIRFGPNDIIYGDVHSNDTMIICGSTFSGIVETANTGTPLYSTPSGCTNRSINAKRVATLPLPSTNSGMKRSAACLYTGPTKITYTADGYMNVVSPWTLNTSPTGGTPNAAKCGSPAALRSVAGARVLQLAQDLLYVQDVQTVPTDPNYWAPTTKPASVTCIGADGQSTTSADGIGWSMTSGATTIRYPKVGESPATGWANSANSQLWNTYNPAYGCRNGDLYVSGTVKTLTTAASENYVYVTNDVKYYDRTSDVLGLVGQNAVLVYNPMDAQFDQPMLGQFNLEIDAAIVSVAHTFQVQNYDRGATRGALELFGSIAQKFRGPVGATDPDTGYTKAYQYDTVLKTVSPPKFLEPSTTSFAVTRYAAVPTAFTPTGASTTP